MNFTCSQPRMILITRTIDLTEPPKLNDFNDENLCTNARSFANLKKECNSERKEDKNTLFSDCLAKEDKLKKNSKIQKPVYKR